MHRPCLQPGLRSSLAWALLLAAGAASLLPAADPDRAAGAAQAERRAAAQALRQAETQPTRTANQLRRSSPAGAKTAPYRGAAQEARFIERLLQMPPAQRRRALQSERFRRLPPGQQRRIENRIQRLSQLPPDQQQQVLERFRLFDQLPPEKQTQARQVYRRWRAIPDGRRAVLLEEFDGIRDADPDTRRARFDAAEFQKSYSDEERRVLQDLAALLPDAPEKAE
jgi:hypothetical protein